MWWKDFVQNWLHFSRRDRKAILSLVFLIFVIFLAPTWWTGSHFRNRTSADTSWIAAIRELEIRGEPVARTNSYQPYPARRSNYVFENAVPSSAYELFYFDPNSLAPAEWKKLGLRDRTIQTILHYLDKGGHFREATDLKKIYGLFPDEYERISPYVRIREPVSTENSFGLKHKEAGPRIPVSRYNAVDINVADTQALIALPGIGPKLAARIIHFREKLGGFYSISQVAETYGLPDSTFEKIRLLLKLPESRVKKININTATEEELKAHPYIRWKLAQPILAYRNMHGPFSRVEDLLQVMEVTPEILEKLSPYLSVN